VHQDLVKSNTQLRKVHVGLGALMIVISLFLGASVAADSGWDSRVIPLRVALGIERQNQPTRASVGGTGLTGTVECLPIIEFDLTEESAAFHFDVNTAVTECFAGDNLNDHILRHTISSDLQHTWSALPLTYGGVWLAVDLDLDGYIELVIQRGDLGLGGNGYLDIVSAPDWTLRNRFVMPGMKVYMHPYAVDIDEDPQLELYVTPLDLGGGAHAQLIDYEPAGDSFYLAADIAAPLYTAGPPAVGDFDGDNRMEFISGNSEGYGLFEYDGQDLSYIGQVGSPYDANTNYATAAKPKPGGVTHALLGFSQTDIGFLYQLLEPTGDNVFQLVREFNEITGWSGLPPCGALDTDCDGLDEMLMHFHPTHDLVWEWDEDSLAFVQGCAWPYEVYGAFIRFHATDLNQNGITEWGTINTDNVFRAFESACLSCLEPPPDVLAWWPLDEFGTTAHDIWQDHDGQHVGNPGIVLGKVNAALDLAGTGDFIRVPHDTTLTPGMSDLSVEAWISTVSETQVNPIIGKFDSSTTRGWVLWLDLGERLGFSMGDGTRSDYLSADMTSISDGSWHHVAVTIDRDDIQGMRFYVDGEPVGVSDPTNHTGDLGNSSDLGIGLTEIDAGDSTFYNGMLDEVKVYDRALSHLEIRSIVALDTLGNCKPETFICDCPSQGDFDGDGFITALDLSSEIDVLFVGGTDPRDSDCPTTRGDWDCDAFTTALDLTAVIDHLFVSDDGPCDPCPQ
jgi:hypothetical protein